ncbi:MAG TPA: TonB-dependent receptor [Bacteroidia bacterium]|jgi:iron complex outermembrane receptor protein|nr:TonB-dependent receptor [Bacteroidia bacterium]
MKRIIFAIALLAALPFATRAQDVHGKVLDDSTRQALPFVYIHLEGTYQDCYTDENGAFVLRNVSDTHLLIASMLGYETQNMWLRMPADTSVTILLHPSVHVNSEVIIQSTRVDENAATAHTEVTKEDIAAQNAGQDLPYLLNNLPSVVTTSDAGTGVGYTGLRIRGSDASRVNVTINGIPVNDAESMGTYWVDIPDLASSIENIQVQRGAGTSTNGAGAFGGSLNIQTDQGSNSPFGEMIVSGGSFNTRRITAKAGTGLLNDKWSFETRLSKINSEGYIDRGTSDLSSWYFSGTYHGKKLLVKAITFSGREKTYQAWYGVPQDSLKTNRTFNMAGMYFDSTGAVKYYDNETDNYQQDYYQLHFAYHANPHWNLNWALHATKGKGYYEEFWQGDDLVNYGLDTVSHPSDIVRRLWLDNWFYGATFGAKYNSLENYSLTIGGAWNNYEGYHYNELISGTDLPSGFVMPYRYSNEYAHKSDGNVFIKYNTFFMNDKLNLYVDMQIRNISYSFVGVDTNGAPLPQSASLSFMNPKAGLSYQANAHHQFYYSLCTASKEPDRNDFVYTTLRSRPLAEKMYDGELGWRYTSQKFGANINLYDMMYRNQLVLTGKVNDVGEYTRQNVPESYRRGVEIILGYNLCKNFNVSGNATLSQNKIKNFHEFIDNYDTGTQIDSLHTLPDIAFSPSVIGALQMTYSYKSFSASLQGKYVGKQYLDNTQNDSRALDPYFNLNLNLSWTAIKQDYEHPKCCDELKFSLLVNNLTNAMYSSNGYTYGWIEGGTYALNNYYYPQAGINFLGMITMKFGPQPTKPASYPVSVVPQ